VESIGIEEQIDVNEEFWEFCEESETPEAKDLPG